MDSVVAKLRKTRRRRREKRVELISVYRVPKVAMPLLYRLLQEREPHVNISHRRMPSWKEHLRFIAGRPYSAWHLIKSGDDYVGAIYLTALDEIGIGILTEFRDQNLEIRAVRALMSRHSRKRFLANVNPKNLDWINILERQLKFTLIQHTYELRFSEKSTRA